MNEMNEMNEKEVIAWLEDQGPFLKLSSLSGSAGFWDGDWKLEICSSEYYGNSIVEVVNQAAKNER